VLFSWQRNVEAKKARFRWRSDLEVLTMFLVGCKMNRSCKTTSLAKLPGKVNSSQTKCRGSSSEISLNEGARFGWFFGIHLEIRSVMAGNQPGNRSIASEPQKRWEIAFTIVRTSFPREYVQLFFRA
jgi:hypothetical protein